MRERIKDAERLTHILEAIDGIQMNQKIYSLEDVEKNSIIFYGFVKYLEIIGEAVYMTCVAMCGSGLKHRPI